MQLTKRQVGTVLAALRFYQERRDRWETENIAEIATDYGTFKKLSDNEIDELCEQINFAGAQSDDKTQKQIVEHAEQARENGVIAEYHADEVKS